MRANWNDWQRLATLTDVRNGNILLDETDYFVLTIRKFVEIFRLLNMDNRHLDKAGRVLKTKLTQRLENLWSSRGISTTTLEAQKLSMAVNAHQLMHNSNKGPDTPCHNEDSSYPRSVLDLTLFNEVVICMARYNALGQYGPSRCHPSTLFLKVSVMPSPVMSRS
jgi:hypothetical protein